tara:strand:- start:527 stop:1303 length:777 start_codon:yes stop_codon:yes gene_type:complete
MDISIEKNSDLLEFINSEVYTTDIDINKAYLYFNTCCCKTLIELDKKLKNLNDKPKRQEIIMGTQMFFHVFFVLLSYTNNLKLTIFLAERAILLYTEFIIMSNDKQVMKDVCYQPSITDPILFAYKKTIGPIPANMDENTQEFNLLKSSSLLLREIYVKYYDIFENEENISDSHLDNLDNIESTLSTIIIELFSEIYSMENLNILLSKQIFLFFDDSNTDDFFDKVEKLKSNLIKIQENIETYDSVSESFIEEVFKTK